MAGPKELMPGIPIGVIEADILMLIVPAIKLSEIVIP